MRRLLVGALLLAGCQDYNELKKDFCDTARIKHFVSEDPDGTIHSKTTFRAFCDDFEGGSIDATKWQQNVSGGALQAEVIDSSFDFDTATRGTPTAYRGHGIVHVTAGPMQTAQLVEDQIIPMQAAPAVRFFLWPGLSAGTGAVDLFELDDAQHNPVRTVSLVNGAPIITDNATGATSPPLGQLIPTHWSCFEVDSLPNRVDVVVDRGSGTAFAVSLGDLAMPAPITAMRIGAKRGDDSLPTTDLWLDELIIDSNPTGPAFAIGCAP